MIFSNLSVDENLAMGAYLQKDPRSVAESREYVFGDFSPGFGSGSGRPPAPFSRGAQQPNRLRSAGRSWATRSS